jgi:dTDP-4-amino-4,6-dideoxygalactose transaminase
MQMRLAINGGEPVRRKPFPSWPIVGSEEAEQVKDVLCSGRWCSGYQEATKCRQFEEAFAEYYGVRHAITVTNGTHALEVALRASGVGVNDEVIVPNYTFIAPATVVLSCNAVPVFVDVDPETLCIDPRFIRAAITRKTKAIVLVHLAGLPCDVDRILPLAREHGLAVIEDCAQAHGAEWNGKRVGGFGDFGTFSFQMSKQLTAGEGGMVVFDDDCHTNRVEEVINCGRNLCPSEPSYLHRTLGSNFRMPELLGALLLAQFERFKEQVAVREKNGLYLTESLGRIAGIQVQRRDPRVTQHGYFEVLFRYKQQEYRKGLTRGAFSKALAAEGIPVCEEYPAVYTAPVFEALRSARCTSPSSDEQTIDCERGGCPISEAVAEDIVLLPHRVLLGERPDMDDIVEAVCKIRASYEDVTA